MAKVYPRSTIFCCFSFSQKLISRLVYGMGIGILSIVLFSQLFVGLIIPYKLGGNEAYSPALYQIEAASLVCHDRFESDCQANLNVRTFRFAMPGPFSCSGGSVPRAATCPKRKILAPNFHFECL